MIEYSAARGQRALAASRMAASAIFFVGGAGLTVWATFIPLLKVRAGLDDAQIGMVLLCVSLGCLCGMPIGLHEATHDRDLPEAAGGVEGDLKPKAKARTKAERIAAEGDA